MNLRVVGQEQGKVLDDDDFLRVHWIMYFDHGGDRGSELGNFAEDLLHQRFVVQRIQAGELSAELMLDYVQSLARSSETAGDPSPQARHQFSL